MKKSGIHAMSKHAAANFLMEAALNYANGRRTGEFGATVGVLKQAAHAYVTACAAEGKKATVTALIARRKRGAAT